MSNVASISARLGVDTSSWKTNLKDASADVVKFSTATKETAAVVAALERSIRSTGSATAEQIKQLKAAKDTLADYRSALKQAERDQKTFDIATSGGDRANRAHGGGGNTGELMHSARAVMDMTLAGQSPVQAGLMEVPRVMQGMGAGLASTIPGTRRAGFGVSGRRLHQHRQHHRTAQGSR